ncbi:dihydroorotase [Candidatus Peregrinibacteria bacterium]|nr:dihydroorotase [Candidatus Peregrinibacteria bacterium]
MPQLLIKNGRLLDPKTKCDEIADILIENERIVRVGKIVSEPSMNVIDATEKLVVPGIYDIHVHLRDLEQSHKETIETGTAAARRGGVTTVLAMPNTQPPLDRAERIREYQQLIQANARVQVYIAGGITRDLKNEALAELDSYPSLGIRVISNDGWDVEGKALLKAAYKKAKELGLLVMTHAEMMNMASGAPINDGPVASRLGVLGSPKAKEIDAIERAIEMAETLGTQLHLTHLSCEESVQLVREAKQRTALITCDATPHHFSLTEDEVLRVGSQAKVNPPLRSESDRQAILEGLEDDTIDAIITDHAPHHIREKTEDLMKSAFGFSGLETLVASTLTELYFHQDMDLMKIFAKMVVAPARILGVPGNSLQEGNPADLAIIDLALEKTVDPDQFVSLGHNTPFRGKKLKGWPIATIVRGTSYKNFQF